MSMSRACSWLNAMRLRSGLGLLPVLLAYFRMHSKTPAVVWQSLQQYWTIRHFSWIESSKKMSERQTKAGNQISLSLSHSFTLSFTHSQHAEQLLFSCLCSKITLSLSHSHTLTLSHSRTLTLSHSFNVSFNHS